MDDPKAFTEQPCDNRVYLFFNKGYWPIEAWHDGKVYLLMAVSPDAPPVDQQSIQTFKAIQLGGVKTEKPLHPGLEVRNYPGDLESTFGNKPQATSSLVAGDAAIEPACHLAPTPP